MAKVTMLARNAISASLAECYVTFANGDRYNLMQAKNLEARMEKIKSKVPILGRSGKGNKAAGWEGTGSATLHYNTSIFRKAMKHYKDTGEDFYFDMQITNDDPTSLAGIQTIILNGCNLDSVILAKFDADGEILDEDFDFTFEDWNMPDEFTELEGMR